MPKLIKIHNRFHKSIKTRLQFQFLPTYPLNNPKYSSKLINKPQINMSNIFPNIYFLFNKLTISLSLSYHLSNNLTMLCLLQFLISDSYMEVDTCIPPTTLTINKFIFKCRTNCLGELSIIKIHEVFKIKL